MTFDEFYNAEEGVLEQRLQAEDPYNVNIAKSMMRGGREQLRRAYAAGHDSAIPDTKTLQVAIEALGLATDEANRRRDGAANRGETYIALAEMDRRDSYRTAREKLEEIQHA